MKFTVFCQAGRTSLALLAISLGSIANAARVEYSDGHGDIGLESENGQIELHYHFGDDAVLDGIPLVGEIEYEPGEVYVRVKDNALDFAPVGGATFLGINEGEPFWTLPQSDVAGRPFLGIAAEELEPIFDSATLTLLSVAGPGEFALWQPVGLSGVNVAWQSVDGFGVNPGDDELALNIGGHDHYNWSFAAEGVYDVELLATAQLTGGGTSTDSAKFRFVIGSSTVVPEPSAFASLAIVGTALTITRRRCREI